MIAAWMLYSVAIGLLAGAAAWLAEQALRRIGAPTRGAWLAALVLSAAVTLWPGIRAAASALDLGSAVVEPAPEPPGSPPVMSMPAFTVAPEGSLARLDRPLVILWATASAMALLALAVGAAALRSRRRRWLEDDLEGRTVLVAPDFGPAVVGLGRPRVVLPAWVRELGADARTLVLLHEEEHVRVGDVHALALAALAVAAAPWNPALWLQLHRLRGAIEIDCDRRVLRRGVSPLSYARLLLEVSERRAVPRFLVAPALAEPARTLERRMKMIVAGSTAPRWTAVLFLAGAAFVAGLACEAPTPMQVEDDAPTTFEAVETTASNLAGDPLILIDGVRSDRAALDALEAIARVEVVKGAAAVTIWGEDAAGGAIVVTTEAGAAATRPAERDDPDGLAEEPVFTPYTVAPRLTNQQEVEAALEEEYPPLLRNAGVGGKALVYLFVDADGAVRDVRINEGSGHDAIDDAALRVARTMEFSPALNRDEPAPVWISLPISFAVR